MTSFSRKNQDRQVRQEKKRKEERKLMRKMGGRKSEAWQDRKLVIRQDVAEQEIQAQDRAEKRRQDATA
jgi:hypothetical protein